MRLWLLAVLLVPSSALAYEVKKSSAGVELHWPDDTVVFSPALTGGPSSVAPSEAQQALEASLATWQDALGPEVQLAAGDPAAAGAHTADRINTVRWATAANDPDIEKGVLALTFVAFRADSGEIQDTDIVLNASGFQWTTTTGGCSNAYDLQAALTHELGHALGLAHSIGHTEATMFATSDECDAKKRDLAQDDRDAIAHLYEPAAASPGGCAAGGSPGLAVLGLFAAGLVRRRGRLSAVASLVGMVVAGVPAEAAQLWRLDVDELARSSTLVLRGRVVATSTTPSGPIETVSDVVVDECLAGACPARLAVKRRGGVRGTQGIWVEGEAILPTTGAVVLFVRRAADGTYRVAGGVQGAFHVIGDRAIRDLRGHEVLSGRTWTAGALEIVALASLRGLGPCTSSAP